MQGFMSDLFGGGGSADEGEQQTPTEDEAAAHSEHQPAPDDDKTLDHGADHDGAHLADGDAGDAGGM